MKNFRRTLRIIATLALGTSLAACSSSSTAGSSSSASVADTSGAAPTGVTLTLWHNTADTPALLALYKAFEKASGNTISLVDMPSATFPTAVQTKWATGARPDLLEWHGNRSDLLSLNASKNMVDLTALPFVAKEGALGKVSGTLDGKTYAATLGPLSVWGIFYNKKVFTDAGLQPPKTYADLTTLCTTIKSKAPSVSPIFEAGGSGWPQAVLAGYDYMAQYNVGAAYADAVVAGKSKVNDPAGQFVTGLTAYEALKSANCFNKDATTATWEDSMKAVLTGTAAMVANGTDSISLLDADANGDAAKVDSSVGFVGVSATEALAAYSPSPLGTYYVPKTGDAQKQRAAVDFIQFVTGKGYQTYVDQAQIIPTISDTTTPKLQGLMQDVQKVYTAGAGLTVNSAIPGFGPMGPETGKLLAGQETPAAVGTAMQAYFEQAQAAIGS